MSLTDYHKKAYFGGSLELIDERAYYDANGNMTYQGFAKAGTPTSQAQWLVLVHTYDGTNEWLSTVNYKNVTWDSVPF